MRKLLIVLLFIVLIVNLYGKDAIQDLFNEKWFINIGISQKKEIIFKEINKDDIKNMYIRRFTYPSFYIDILNNDMLITYSKKGKKNFKINFSNDKKTFTKKGYGLIKYIKKESSGNSEYEGTWINQYNQTIEVKKLENDNWIFIMYFPGDPVIVIRRGWYIFKKIENNVYLSSKIYNDYQLKLIIFNNNRMKLIPLFIDSDNKKFINMYDPVSIWKDIK